MILHKRTKERRKWFALSSPCLMPSLIICNPHIYSSILQRVTVRNYAAAAAFIMWYMLL